MQYGALDPRLVRSFIIDVHSCLTNICYLGDIKQERQLRNMWRRIAELQWSFWSRQIGAPSLSYRIPQVNYKHSSEYLQSIQNPLLRFD